MHRKKCLQKPVLDSSLFNPELAQAKTQTAVYLLRLLETPIAIDFNDDFFKCLGWCSGGLKNVSTCLQRSFGTLLGPKKEITKIKNALTALDDYPEDDLASPISTLIKNHYVFAEQLTQRLRHILKKNAQLEQSAKSTLPPAQRHIKTFFGLCKDSLKLCNLAFMLGFCEDMEIYFVDRLKINHPSNYRLIARMLGLEYSHLQNLLKQLRDMGFLELNGFYFRLCDKIEEVWQKCDQRSLQETFCQPVKGSTLPLEDFNIAATEREHVLSIMQNSSTRPVHILLYGVPGSGKTSFARSLTASLKLKAWAVPCSEDDNASNRRASLIACLLMSNRSAGSFVLVDEAERLLDTSIRFGDNSSNKAWLNDFMERENQRVIWIVNETKDIDQAVRRRFSYSLHFEELGPKERLHIWNNVVQRLRVRRRLSAAKISFWTENYPVEPAVIEKAVTQAKYLATEQDLSACVEQVLRAHTTLCRDGEKLTVKEKKSEHYTLEGVCTDQPLETILTQSKRLDKILRDGKSLSAGMGTMLFYGPPGTGKSALARHLAHTLERECIIKRASDLLSPFVGVAEQNIAAAFGAAERDGAVLVIDEADSFIYSRQGALHSWEVTLVNEFLTALEACQTFCICTTNRREEMDSAAMRRFSFKIPFIYAKPPQLMALYNSLLAPLVKAPPCTTLKNKLSQQTQLTPGDFHVVHMQYRLAEPEQVSHDILLKALLEEQNNKLKPASKTIGFMQ